VSPAFDLAVAGHRYHDMAAGGELNGVADESASALQARRPNAAYFCVRDTPAQVVGRTPWSAAGPPAGSSPVSETWCIGKERDEGVPRGPGGPPY